MSKKRIVIQIAEILVGMLLLYLSIAGKVDEFWSGVGGGLTGVGIVYLVQTLRYHKNREYRENVDTERSDERNQFISMKAWQWAGSWFMTIAAVATFIFKFTGKENLMMLSGGSVCLISALYWLGYLYLKKKY